MNHKTFGADDYFERLEQHSAATVDSRSAVEAFPMSTPTKMSIKFLVEVGVFIHSFLFLGVMEGPLPILVAKSRMFPLLARVRPGWLRAPIKRSGFIWGPSQSKAPSLLV